MVKAVDKIKKEKYQQKQSKGLYIFGGIALAVLIGLGVFFFGGQESSNALAGPAPAGDNCPENVAYLQQGVNKYQETTGQFPTELNQLLEKIKEQSPAVEKLPTCPGGNLYVIENGVVKEAPAK